jgi:uncharacterized protein (DUF4415 family)
VSAKRTVKSSVKSIPSREKADLRMLRRVSDAAIRRSAPPELQYLPDDFWDEAVPVVPESKVPISLRVDSDVLVWFREEGPRYQSRMIAVLHSYMHHARKQGKKRSPARNA